MSAVHAPALWGWLLTEIMSGQVTVSKLSRREGTCWRASITLAHGDDTFALRLNESRIAVEGRPAGSTSAAALPGVGKVGGTEIYSVIASEWPSVRSHLRWQLDRPRPSEPDR